MAGSKKTLKDAIDNVAPEETVTSENTNPVEQLESTEVFQNLPQAVKDSLRSGTAVNEDMDDIDKAIALKQQKGLEALNEVRTETGLPPVTADDIKDVKTVEDVKDEKPTVTFETSIEDEVEKQLAFISGENYDDPEEEEDEELAEEKRLLYFEKMMEDAITIEFNPLENKKEVSEDAAPLKYKIKRNTEYEDVLKNVMDTNSINFKTNKKAGIKSALLRDFVNRHPHVTTPLINSGFHITLSGASIPEIIQMNKMKAGNDFELMSKKIKWITDHIVDSSFGKKISATQLSKIVFYKDLETLWFNLILGTLPDIFEYPLSCTNKECGQSMKVKINTADLLLNAADFEDITKYILYENVDITGALNYSKVSKEKKVKVCGGKLIVTIINPTIFDYMMLNTRLEKFKNILGTYTELVGYLLFVKNIGLADENGDFIQFDEIDEMLQLLTALSAEDLEDLNDEIKDFSLCNEVKYGLRSYTCPKCGKVHPETIFDLSTMLFIVCQMSQNSTKLAKLRLKKENEKK